MYSRKSSDDLHKVYSAAAAGRIARSPVTRRPHVAEHLQVPLHKKTLADGRVTTISGASKPLRSRAEAAKTTVTTVISSLSGSHMMIQLLIHSRGSVGWNWVVWTKVRGSMRVGRETGRIKLVIGSMWVGRETGRIKLVTNNGLYRCFHASE